MIELKKSTFAVAALIPIIVVAFVLATCSIVILYFEFQTQDDNGAGEGITPGGQDDGIIPPVSENPPEVAVTLSVPDSYLGDHPDATFTVTNTGGSCTVDYTIFETAPRTGSFSLGEGERETITVTGPQVRDIGAWLTSVQVTATNSYGSDFAQASSTFQVDVKSFDAMPYIDQNELSAASGLLEQISTFIDRFFSGIGPNADGCAKLADPNSPTVRAIASNLISRHPNDGELQVKEIYYWVVDWISYDYGSLGEFLSGTQRELPIQTIYDRTGVCLNYSIVLASLYEAAGFDARIVVVWNGDWPWEWSDQHALVLLYYSGLGYAYYFEEGWIVLDPTAGSTADWNFGEYHPRGYDHYDIADV